MNYELYRDSEEYFAESRGFIKAHFHQSIELLYCINGSRRFVVGDYSGVINKGDLLFVSPFDNHEYLGEQDASCYCNVLPVEYSELLKAYVGNRIIKNPIIPASPITEDIYNHLKQISSHSNAILKQGIYEYVLGKIIETVEFVEVKKSGNTTFTRRVLEYIDLHFSEDISLDKIASALGYSRYYFSVLFNKAFNTNFKTYLNQVRINKSLPLLEKYSISVVASLCGYNSLQAFFLNFKNVMNTSPKLYLKNKTFYNRAPK